MAIPVPVLIPADGAVLMTLGPGPLRVTAQVRIMKARRLLLLRILRVIMAALVTMGPRAAAAARRPLLRTVNASGWHDAQMQQTIGLVTVGAGFVLILLGIVRIAFAKVEKQFASESDENAMY